MPALFKNLHREFIVSDFYSCYPFLLFHNQVFLCFNLCIIYSVEYWENLKSTDNIICVLNGVGEGREENFCWALIV